MNAFLTSRRRWLQATALGALPLPALAAPTPVAPTPVAPTPVAPDASERLLPSSADLPRDLAAALARKEPLVVLATLRGCPYCKIAREHYLLPLQRAGACVTQIHFLSDGLLRDWSGTPIAHGALVRQLGIEVAPTVLFYGPGHKEVAERLAGSYIPDFYGAYLDQRMEQARAALRRG